jgi:sulfur carrier protein
MSSNTIETFDILVNGQPHTFAAHGTLADLIVQLRHAPDSVATALNGEFVARGERAARVLCDGDRVTCFQAITGG